MNKLELLKNKGKETREYGENIIFVFENKEVYFTCESCDHSEICSMPIWDWDDWNGKCAYQKGYNQEEFDGQVSYYQEIKEVLK